MSSFDYWSIKDFDKVIIKRYNTILSRKGWKYIAAEDWTTKRDKRIGELLARAGAHEIKEKIGVSVKGWYVAVIFHDTTATIVYWKMNYDYGIALHDVLYDDMASYAPIVECNIEIDKAWK